MGKNKKKKKHLSLYDYSEFNYDGDMRKLMKDMADSLKEYLHIVNSVLIIEGVSEIEWKEKNKEMKKLIKKLKKGDPSVFNVESFNECIDSGHSPIIGLK